MLNLSITVLLSLIIIGLLVVLFRWVKKPYYRVDKARMIQVLEMVLTGQATENDWRLTFGMTIRHDPELELFRQGCCDIEARYFIGDSHDRLFSAQGLEQLKQSLEQLKELESK